MSTGQTKDIFELSFSSHYTPAELFFLTSAVYLVYFQPYLNV